MKTKFILEVEGLSKRRSTIYTLKDISFKVKDGECWAFTGRSGSGKTALLRSILQYRSFPDSISFGSRQQPRIEYVPGRYQFSNLSGVGGFYYQQRYNASEAYDALTVEADLRRANLYETARVSSTFQQLGIAHLKHAPLLHLSTGELKRYQIAKALLNKADWLLLDDPLAGLDKEGREELEILFTQLLHEGTRMLVAADEPIPKFVSHVAVLSDGILTGIYDRADQKSYGGNQPGSKHDFELPPALLQQDNVVFETAVDMRDVHVRYHEKTVLKGISWTVRKGDKWSLSGPNGSGKSTLLSLITADNPQAFANDIVLFDRQRGSGETIWDIKRNIGYISSELHDHFDKGVTCFDAVASGLFDSVGLFRKLNAQQRLKVSECLKAFGLVSYEQTTFGSVPFGVQRLILLARAIIRNAPLLVLDEPCRGLDHVSRARFLQFLNVLCDQHRTLIYVTHLEDEIPPCINQFLKLENGIIKEIKEYGKDDHGDSRRRHRA